jgi:hypothetical protein
MPKKPKWYESVWKVIGVLAVIFGLIASALQIFGTVNFWNPLYDFFTLSVPIYYFAALILGAFVVLLLLALTGSYEGNILDDEYGRHLAILCQDPRTTDYLRRKLEGWKNRDGISGRYGINGYLKRLENEKYLEYSNEEWKVTDKALDYIDKYHGD